MPQKNAAAVALGRKGGKIGGPARAAKMTPEQRSASARKAVQARWAKVKTKMGSSQNDHIIEKKKNMRLKKLSELQITEATPAHSLTSRKALHLCLNRLKNAKDENEIRRLTEELQRIVFHKQHQNAEN